ncbi:TIM barrel protein [Croceicoccus sp. F390]|uniref:TIM barrel protein n=1 Tax=Croceicoccus esteveae TaxID=3075597 RepID=A0ABU2ZL01_9SPHN|nr:TIM barrel protein [Croceicoccus sp. F390]MDT0577066.1 TIM barrel protein [Croceicoccus sp. F390]
MRLALDHMTAVDAMPVELAQAAHDGGCRAMCLFMHSMEVLPLMPQFNLYNDREERRELGRCMDALGVGLDLAYPFTLAGRTDVDTFGPALDCAAQLGARLVNVLCYDRDADRRLDRFGRFCDLAAGAGLSVAVEFYPPSQIRSLAQALALVGAIDRPGRVGINVDLLHLMRSGGSIAELAAAPEGTILYGQFADGPAHCHADAQEQEASSERLLPGEGTFDLRGFAAALPPDCPTSVEIPRDHAVLLGEPRAERVQRAVAGVRNALGEG